MSAPGGCPVSAGAAAFNPFEPAYMQAPGDYLRWSREQEPVFWSPQLGYWVVTRYEDVKAVFRDNLLFSPAVALEKITPATPEVMDILQRYGFAMNRTMVNEDEPDHMARRRLLMDAFLPERLLGYEPMVRALARQYMDRFIDDGRADLVGQMFYEIPLNIALKFLGVPEEGAEQLRQFAVAHTLNTWGRPTAQEQLEIAEKVGRFWQTAQRILDDMLARPDGEGWMYESIRQHLKHPDIVTMSYLRSMMMAILAAAHETTSNATANAFMTLLTQRPAWEAICANPALIPNAVEECLRVAGSIIAWRRIATADTHLGGVPIPKGNKLLIVQASANFDPRHFENPDRVDLYRENAVEHLTFGYGAHQCMGKNIGRMQMRVFLEEFARRLPHMRLAPDQTFDFLPNTSFRGPAELWVEWDPASNPERLDPALAGRHPAGFYIGPPAKDGIARTVVLRDKQPEGEGLWRFVLADPAGGDMPAWTAGGHVDLMAGGFRRKYSLCGPALDRKTLQVVVQREADGRGGSRYFCDHLAVGDELQLAGPKNLFRLDESAERFALIAGGIGITPVVAMADRLKQLGKPYEIRYAGRSRGQMALLDRLERDHAGTLALYVKAEGRRMTLPEILSAVDADTRVYACGPDRLIDELEVLSQRWPEGVLHFEHFSAAHAALAPSEAHGFVAQLKDSNLEIAVAAGQTLLQALQAAGVDVPCDCGEGLCGTCEVAVIDGKVDHRDKVLSKAERAANQRMMACCSRAVGQRIILAL
ncbi:MAG: cytochrome P450/oxidoreductase [Hydrogenophaga sp.]|nr:cytochrome P450/oxidoreductase [Hydrogenophaga sp.]